MKGEGHRQAYGPTPEPLGAGGGMRCRTQSREGHRAVHLYQDPASGVFWGKDAAPLLRARFGAKGSDRALAILRHRSVPVIILLRGWYSSGKPGRRYHGLRPAVPGAIRPIAQVFSVFAALRPWRARNVASGAQRQIRTRFGRIPPQAPLSGERAVASAFSRIGRVRGCAISASARVVWSSIR